MIIIIANFCGENVQIVLKANTLTPPLFALIMSKKLLQTPKSFFYVRKNNKIADDDDFSPWLMALANLWRQATEQDEGVHVFREDEVRTNAEVVELPQLRVEKDDERRGRIPTRGRRSYYEMAPLAANKYWH